MINTVQFEVIVGSKYWILSGLAVSQFSSENFNSIKILTVCALIMFIIATTNKSVVYEKMYIMRKSRMWIFIYTSFSFYAW